MTENGETLAEYTYDDQSQLISETLPLNNLEYSYSYDTGGNIRSVTKTEDGITATRTYTYGDSNWSDLLTAIDGHSITYDTIGNPLTYYNGEDWNFTWEEGRNLKSAQSGSTAISYEYGSDGLRHSKTVDGEIHTYIYLGGQLAEERWGENVMKFSYDEQGRPYSVKYNNDQYYYILNQQGDVIRIINGDGVTRGEYTYNAWGELIEITTTGTIGEINPLRYRGYYYDAETGFYYVSSRYYDPEIGRFISADTTEVLGVSNDLYDKNLYAYCDNNPVMRKDSGGEFWTIASGALIGAVISAGIEFGMQVASGGKIDIFNIGLAALGGAAGGALAASSFGYIGQVIGNAAISGVSEVISQVRSGNRDLGSIVLSAGKMAAVGAASVVIGGKGIKAKGTPYANSLNSLNSVKGNVSQAISNPSVYKQQINSAITTHQVTSRAAVKSTTKSFAKASFFSNFVGRVKSFFGW